MRLGRDRRRRLLLLSPTTAVSVTHEPDGSHDFRLSWANGKNGFAVQLYRRTNWGPSIMLHLPHR